MELGAKWFLKPNSMNKVMQIGDNRFFIQVAVFLNGQKRK